MSWNCDTSDCGLDPSGSKQQHHKQKQSLILLPCIWVLTKLIQIDPPDPTIQLYKHPKQYNAGVYPKSAINVITGSQQGSSKLNTHVYIYNIYHSKTAFFQSVIPSPWRTFFFYLPLFTIAAIAIIHHILFSTLGEKHSGTSPSGRSPSYHLRDQSWNFRSGHPVVGPRLGTHGKLRRTPQCHVSTAPSHRTCSDAHPRLPPRNSRP